MGEIQYFLRSCLKNSTLPNLVYVSNSFTLKISAFQLRFHRYMNKWNFEYFIFQRNFQWNSYIFLFHKGKKKTDQADV